MSNQPLAAAAPERSAGQDASSEHLSHCYDNAIERLQSTFTARNPLVIMLDDGRIATKFVLDTFLSDLDDDVALARVTEHCRDATDLMRKIVDAAGFQSKDMCLTDLESVFEMFLSFQKRHASRTVVCIEKLHKDDLWVLDMIRGLVEREIEGRHGLLVIICAESGFEENLTDPLNPIAELGGRRIRLAPFTLKQTTEQIRLQVEADGLATMGQVFQYQAIPLIHKLSSGVPDAVESLVNRSLHAAKRDGVELVTTSIVERAYESAGAKSDLESVGADEDTVKINDAVPLQRRLLVQLTGEVARKQALRQGHTLIGRSDLCDIRIESQSVSRHHALIKYADNGVTLVDLGSTNGVLVNGRRVMRCDLVPGDSITLGECQIDYLVDADSQADLQAAARQSPEAH